MVGRNRPGVSGYFGVRLHPRGRRWQARINFKNMVKYIGTFDSALEAAIAYDRVATKYGKRLNFPEGITDELIRRSRERIPKVLPPDGAYLVSNKAIADRARSAPCGEAEADTGSSALIPAQGRTPRE